MPRTPPMNRLGWLLIASVVLGCLPGIRQTLSAEDLITASVSRMGDDLRYLSSDELEGRNSGSEGIRKAGEFIVDRFNALGLKTDSFNGTPYQEFSIAALATLGPAEKNTLRFAGSTSEVAPALGASYTPVSLGSNGAFEGEVVFAGYGITAADLNYDDYSDIDVSGKVVIVLRKAPRYSDPNGKFKGNTPRSPSQHALFTTKESNAAAHQAAALIIVNDFASAESTDDALLGVSDAGSANSELQVPTLFCSRALLDPLVTQATGKSLLELEQAIDADLKPRSQLLTGIRAAGETLTQGTPVRNVIGFLPGAGALADEYVVVGAHYDHVGMGGPGSLASGTIAVHNGADDNGSGTTAVMEIARRLTEDHAENRRSIIFIMFTGEEKGLLGSQHYVRSPRWPLEQTVAMVNLDMVGRLAENTLTVYGTGTAQNFDSLIDQVNAVSQFNLVKVAAGFGPSDHASFYGADIPVFHFFTGLHNDYHRPSDDFEKVDLVGMARIVGMVTDVVHRLATEPERPQLIKSKERAQITGYGRGRGGSRRAVLGIQLDLASDRAAVDEVVEGGPAAAAGLQAGDIIERIDATETQDVGALRQVLSGHKPGDKIKLTIRRGPETLELDLQLGEG